jgi:hypothetical protein
MSICGLDFPLGFCYQTIYDTTYRAIDHAIVVQTWRVSQSEGKESPLSTSRNTPRVLYEEHLPVSTRDAAASEHRVIFWPWLK